MDEVTSPLRHFSDPTQTWFAETLRTPTAAQAGAWPGIASGEHTVVIAPTGSGKTLAAFLWALDGLLTAPAPAEAQRRCRVVYVSPLKALAADVRRNLRAPLAGITQVAERDGSPVNHVTVGSRTGDTPAAERRKFATRPPDVLITTPESLYLMLTSSAREGLRGVEQVIIDEVHVLAGSKRGAHLSVSLERLDALQSRPAQRIGLSATIQPADEVARYLAGVRSPEHGGRATRVVHADDADSSASSGSPESVHLIPAPRVNIQVAVPVADLTDVAGSGARASADAAAQTSATSIWSHVTETLVDLITTHSATIVFANSRRSCERLAARVNEAYAARRGWATPDPGASVAAQAPGQSGTAAALPQASDAAMLLASPHHGSMSHQERATIETALKNGTLPAVIATSSLELGIDMGAVDLVVQVGAPPSVAAALQRIGRASHQVGGISSGVVLPTHRGDLLAAAVTCAHATTGQIEATQILSNPLDVLAQQIVAMCAVQDWGVADLTALIRRAAPFCTLSQDLLHSVLDMLTGRYPSEEFAQLHPLLVWDRNAGRLSARRGAQLRATVSGGTIPDRGLYGVHLAGTASSARGGSRVGELDEEMVYESRPGDTFTLGSSTWRIEDITTDRVLVSPAPGLPGRLPFWKGDTPGRPAQLGRAIGAAVRAVEQRDFSTESVAGWPLQEWAQENLLTYLRDQREATGQLPTENTIVVERFRDELGDWRVVLHSFFGARVHAPWALLISARLQQRYGFDVAAMHSDDGIVLRLPGGQDPAEATVDDGTAWAGPQFDAEHIPVADLIPDPVDLQHQIVQQLQASPHFAARFRQAAARSLLLPRSRPGKRAPLWQQRQRSAQLLSVAAGFPQFPVTLEAVRECLQDDFDTPALTHLLQQLHADQVRIVDVTTAKPSPFAQSLLMGYVRQFIYGEDAPPAQQQAAALALDADLIDDLLGAGSDVAELLDVDALTQVEAEVGLLTERHRARSPDQVADLIRRLGPVTATDLSRRTAHPTQLRPWLADLHRSGRVFALPETVPEQWAVVEDAARIRDGLGVEVPAAIPNDLLAPAPEALHDLVRRFARTRGPFRAQEAADHYHVPVAAVTAILAALRAQGVVAAGVLRPAEVHTAHTTAMPGPDFCDAQVLRRIRRRSLHALRAKVAPVAQDRLSSFLADWQQIGQQQGTAAVWDVLDQLAGTPIAASAWESLVLPQRIPDYQPRMLDELTSAGEVVWVGAGTGPGADGVISLLPAEAIADLAPPAVTLQGPVIDAVLVCLASGGKFFTDLLQTLRAGNQTGWPTQSELIETLWQAAWAGLVTNDTLAPLRARLGGRRRPRTSLRRRSRTGASAWLAGASSMGPDLTARPRAEVPDVVQGRWSLVGSRSGPERRAVVATAGLLERDGIITRGNAAERIPGGFAAAYRILSQLEESGQVQRGFFIEGLGGAQFATESAVTGLREQRNASTPLLLAATDPANPFGAALDWPQPHRRSQQDPTEAPGHRPGRKVGAFVVIVDGTLVLYLERGGKTLLSFTDASAAVHAAATELVAAAERGTVGRFTLARIDGASALGNTAVAARALQQAGFIATPSGLRIRRR